MFCSQNIEITVSIYLFSVYPLVPKWWNTTSVPVGSGVLNIMQINNT